MSIWDGLVLLLIAGLGAGLWFYDDNIEGWRDWLIKFVILAVLLFGPYFFWDEIGAYWSSSADGPVNIETGWW